jgi:hypothetical protein
MFNINYYGYMPAYSGDPRFNFHKQFDRSISVSCDTVTHDPDADIKILMQCEPPAIYGSFSEQVKANYQNFDLVLTYLDDLLTLPNAQKFIACGSWIGNLNLEKKDQITYLMSSKIWTPAHMMRFMILRRVENKKNLGYFKFSMHRNPPRIEFKDDFFRNAKFNIACENQIMPNMFSEKLLDCFKTKTVPIYYGCTNIEEYFNPLGIIRFNNIEEFDSVIKSIKPGMYEEMLPYIEENYEISRQYWEKTIHQRVEDIIEIEILKKYPVN